MARLRNHNLNGPATSIPPGPSSPHRGFTAGVIRYYRVLILLVIAIVVYGLWAFLLLPRTEDPEFDVFDVRIVTLYPGVVVEQVEELVTRVIEEAIEELDGIRTIESTSSGGLSEVKAFVEDDAVPNAVEEAIQDKVEEIRSDLPPGIEEPWVFVFNTADIPVSIVALTGPPDYHVLSRWAESIQEELETIETVSSVEIEGLPERQILVDVDNQRLSQYQIPLAGLTGLLQRENAAIPGGELDVGNRRFLVETPNELESLADIGDVVVGSYQGSAVFLRDVARIEDDYEDPTYFVRTDRRPALLLTVTKRERTNTIAVAREVRETVAELALSLPPTMELRLVSDRGLGVQELLGNLSANAIAGGVIVVVTVTLFLGGRQASVVSISIPLSVLIAFMAMEALAIDLNQVSIFGLVLALGMLVDSSLVVVENIARHLDRGAQLIDAVVAGVEEVRMPVLSSTLTTVAAFIPMLFMTQNMGAFIFGMPVTLILALTASLLVAVTVIPLLCYAVWRRFPPPREQGLEESRWIERYSDVAKAALRNRALTWISALAAFAVSLLAIPALGLELFPKAEKRFFLIDLRLPDDANLHTTDLLAARVEEILAGEEPVRDFTTNVGRGSPRIYYNVDFENEKPSFAQILVNLDEDFETSTEVYVEELQEKLDRIAGASVEARILEQGPFVGAPIQVRVTGDDLETLKTLATRIAQRIQDIDGIADLRDTLGEKIPRLAIDLDKEKAGLLGVDSFSFAQTLFAALHGETVSQYRETDEEIPLVVRLDRRSIREISDLERLYLSTSGGSVVPFGEVATAEERLAFAAIHRRDGRREVTVQSGVRGRLASEVLTDVERRLAGLELPRGYSLTFAGESEERDESFQALGRAMVLAILLIYGILAVQFNSFVQPFVILLTVPFGIIGAVFGLMVTGNPFGFMAFIGIVSLTGIIINDSIVLVDFANYLQRVEGRGMYEALLEAGRRRFRPVILTSVTTIAGMTPLAIWGGSLWSPLACAIIFGLMGSTILILVTLPVIYATLIGPQEAYRAFRIWPELLRRLFPKEG